MGSSVTVALNYMEVSGRRKLMEADTQTVGAQFGDLYKYSMHFLFVREIVPLIGAWRVNTSAFLATVLSLEGMF